jgi:uncharacterized protein (TIGR00255 family)
MKSMTGYGAGRADGACGNVSIELRTVNGRFLDLSFRLPAMLSFAEPALRRSLMARLARGKVHVSARFDSAENAPPAVTVNRPLLRLLAEEARALAPDRPIAAETLLLAPGVVVPTVDSAMEEALAALVERALAQALDALEADRAREGRVLADAMLAIHARLEENHALVAAAGGSVAEKYRDRLRERIAELLAGTGVAPDPARIEQELALFADKADIGEECVRLGAHLDELRAILSGRGKGDAAGRRLDFLAQEIGREINTIGSKCRDLGIAKAVLAMKLELESLREQLANIE